MSTQIECALLGVGSGVALMPTLCVLTDLYLAYLQRVHGIQADELLSGD